MQLFIGLTVLFGTDHRSHCTISTNFYIYLQYFQQKVFSFSKISGSQTDSWYDSPSTSISVCGMWGAKVEIQVTRRKLHTHIQLDYDKVEFLFCINNNNNNNSVVIILSLQSQTHMDFIPPFVVTTQALSQVAHNALTIL